MAMTPRRTNQDGRDSATRRDFLKGGAIAGIGGAATLAGLGVQQASAQGIRWDREADVVVIGAGASGVAAAIAARDQGVSVIVVDQNFDVGGMAINSGGMVQMGCGNQMQKDAGVDDSPDQFFLDWIQKDHPVTRYSDRDIIRKFADEAVPTWNFLIDNGVTFNRLGRSGGVLAMRTTYVTPWPVREEQPTRGNNGGSGLMRALEKSARAKGVQFMLQHRMQKIHRERPDSGRVLGIQAIECDIFTEPSGRTVNIRARKGVVIGTGGHTGNVPFRRMFDPRLTEEYSAHCGLCNPKRAEGELAAMSIGASLWSTHLQTNEYTSTMQEGTSIGVWFNGGARFPTDSTWFKRVKYTGLMVKDWQDVVLVKEHGKRFYDETMTDLEGRRDAAKRGLPYSKYGYYSAALEWTGDRNKLNGGGPIWAIFDQAAVEREGWEVKPPYAEPGFYFVADTLEELAAKLKANKHQWRAMPGQSLRQTIERYNSFVDAGKDTDFKKPTPVFKIETPPFYAAWAIPNPNDCYAGLRINTNAQVMDTKGEVIPSLYCAGDSASGIALHGLGKALLFGRVAGIHAAKLNTDATARTARG